MVSFRAELAVMVGKAISSSDSIPQETVGSMFTDVDSEDWAAEWILVLCGTLLLLWGVRLEPPARQCFSIGLRRSG